MTQTRTALTAAALFLTLLAIAGIGVLQSFAQPQQAVAVVATIPVEPEMHRIDAIPDFSLAEVAAFAPSTDLSTAQVASMLEVADQICEGMTAGVPLLNMADSLVWNQGLTDTEAHDFVRAVAQTHC